MSALDPAEKLLEQLKVEKDPPVALAIFEALGEGRFLPHEVKLGIETDDYYAIEAGLTAGTKVVTSAQFLLDSEAKLQESIQRRLDAIAAGRK